jgi:post-segregation antitoxin (ccd killing protein)
MPKMQVYLPAELYEKVKERPSLNVSNLLQRALEEELAELERREALESAVLAYERKHGKISPAAIARQKTRDAAAARRSRIKRRGAKAA